MRIDIVSLLPDMFVALNYGITGRAQNNNLLDLVHWNPRDFTEDKHKTVDDRPYGGGPGMLMKVAPLQQAICAAKASHKEDAEVIYFSPTGELLTQKHIKKFSEKKRFIVIAGRYEGIDQRLINGSVDSVWSIGDYVLSGGELAVMVFIDALTRLIPGSLGDETSAQNDSFSDGLLEYPHYTRPEIFAEQRVPTVLLSGDHKAIERWRLKQALGITWLKRPDMIKQRNLTALEQTLLDEFIEEFKKT